MAAKEALLTWSASSRNTRPAKEEESSMATMRARLHAMTLVAQAKDAALDDLQRRLKEALEEAEQARTREAALLRRAQRSEEAEEALASQMAEVEAEAFIRITEANKLLAAREPPITASLQSTELESRLQVALQEAAALARRCDGLEEEVEEGRVREAAFRRRAEIAEAAEEAVASQMAEVEAEAFTRITENSRLLAQGRDSLHDEQSRERTEATGGSQEVELERQLAEAGAALEAVHAKLRQAEEKNRLLEVRLAEQAREEEKAVTLKRKQDDVGEDTLLSLSLQDLAGFVKLKLWNPSSLTLTSAS